MSLHKLTLAFICTVSSVICVTSAHAVDDSKIIDMPSSQLNWEITKEGVGFAPLQGNRFNEAYMAMVKLPAGLISPAHIKTANMYGLVISGTITNVAVGAPPSSEIELPTGAYYKIPAGLAHVSKCISTVDCITFLYQDAKFDFLPISQ